MGKIKYIIKNKKVKTPMLNNRFTVELCENVHVHYRNLRLEFDKNEFTFLLGLLKEIDIKTVENFEYSEESFKSIIYSENLPDKTYFNNRLQIEKQVEGHYHLHYRNLRLEFYNLSDFYIKESKDFFLKTKLIIKNKLHSFHNFIIKKLPFKNGSQLLMNKKINIDEKYYNEFISKIKFKHYSIKKIKISKLVCRIYTPEGFILTSVNKSPSYNYLIGNKKEYEEYNTFKSQILKNKDIHNNDRFTNLINSIHENGFNTKNVIIVNENNEIIDGQHRAAILLNKHGLKYKIPVLKLYSIYNIN